MAKNPFDEFDNKPSAPNPFDEFDEPPKSRGVVDTAKDYAGAASSALGQGVLGAIGGLGSFAQAPAANTLAAVMGARALVDRGVTAALNTAVPGSTQLDDDVQAQAQMASRHAADQRAQNVAASDSSASAWLNPRTAIARLGLGLQEDSRARIAEIEANDRATNPELVRQQRAQAEAEGFVGNVKAMAQNPMATAHTLMRSAPDMIGGLGVARRAAMSTMSKAGAVADAAAGRVAAAGGDIAAQAAAASEAVNALGKVAVARASTAGMLSEAVSSGNSSREGVFQQVMNLPPEKLAASPRYQQILRSVDDPDRARQMLANELADQAPLLASAGTMTGSMVTRKLFGGDTTAKAVAGVERTTLKHVGKNVMEEGVEEGLQGVPEDLAQHGAVVQADPSKKFDLGGTLAQNMVAGSLMGGGGTGARFAQQKLGDIARPGQAGGKPGPDAGGGQPNAEGSRAADPAQPTPATTAQQVASDSEPAATGPALPPEARLAQLDILAETRGLSQAEQAEHSSLSSKLDQPAPGADGVADQGEGTGPGVSREAMAVDGLLGLRVPSEPAGAAAASVPTSALNFEPTSNSAATPGLNVEPGSNSAFHNVAGGVGQGGLRKVADTSNATATGGAWQAFPAESGTHGIPRADMPQIRAEHRGAMVNFLNARGIAHEQIEVPASSLKPTQAEFSPAKVKKAAAYTGGERSILVSSDGYVVDGHHQWLAKLQAGEPIKAIRLAAPIRDLLPAVREFPSAGTSKGATGTTQVRRAPTDFWSFVRAQNLAISQVKVGSEQWTALQAKWKAQQARGQQASGEQPQQDPAVGQAAPAQADTALQNRDRSRAASVAQMSEIMRRPDYGRLGASRTPESGAPMVFAVGDDTTQIRPEQFGITDRAVMSDGQRVSFQYAVVNAEEVQPSNLVDGRANPAYVSSEPGAIKALNNGRTAGVRAAHALGTASQYVSELKADAANLGIDPDVIDRVKNPMLVRVYSERDNTADMAAKSQGAALGMSPAELARQDAPLLDASVLSVFRSGDITSAANRDFVRAFVGKLRQSGQDIASMMTQDGMLSQSGRQRLQAALMQAAYGDAELVQELFDSVETDIKAIGEALKTAAGEWASMRDSALMGAIDPATDITGNVMAAVNLVRRARRERKGLHDLAQQTDMLTGDAVDPLTAGALRLFFSGQHLTRALGKDRTIAMLRDYVAGAMTTRPGVDLLGDVADPTRILYAIFKSKTDEGTQNAHTPSTQSRGEPGRDGDLVRRADEAVDSPQEGAGLADARSGAEPGEDRTLDPQTGRRTLREAGQATDQGDGVAPTAASSSGQGRGATAVGGSTSIEDAGEKIGGARKDLWRERGLAVADLDSMSEAEGATLVTKANVWKPDYADMATTVGEPVTVAMVKVIYDSLAAKPKANTPEGRRDYVRAMQAVREVYSGVRTVEEAKNAYVKLREALGVRTSVGMGAWTEVGDGAAAAKRVMFSVYKGRSDPFVLSVNELQRARKLVTEGFPGTVDPWKRRFDILRAGGVGSTDNGTAAIVKHAQAIGTPVTVEQARAGVFQVVAKSNRSGALTGSTVAIGSIR